MDFKEYLKKQLATGNIKQVIESLLEASKANGQSDLNSNVVLISSRYISNESENRAGRMDPRDYRIEKNRIVDALQFHISEFKDNGKFVWKEPVDDMVTDGMKKKEEIDKFQPLVAINTSKPKYEERRFEEIEADMQQSGILLVTATKVETTALHSKMLPVDGAEGLIKTKRNNAIYYFGLLGKWRVTHVECGDMGSTSSMGAILTVSNAIEKIKPKFALMVGIAFGVDPEKQNIGDVLVSKSIMNYEIQRVGADRKIMRGSKPEASNSLRTIFNNLGDWEYKLPNGLEATLEVCDVLSGEKLIDNEDYRDELLQFFPTAKGGEMEGAGLYAACQDKKVDWILIKSICDFADGNKGTNKKEKQALAIETALSVCLHAFEQKYIFEDFGIYAYGQSQNTLSSSSKKIYNNELFELLEGDQIPELFIKMQEASINSYSFNRFKKEYEAGLRGIDLIDWKDRMKVFLNGLK